MVKRNKNNSKNLLTVILIILAVVFLLYMFNNGTDELRIKESEFFTMVDEGKVSDVVFSGNTAKIRVVGSEIEVINFPAKYDHYIDMQDNAAKQKVFSFNEDVIEAKNTDEADRTERQEILAGFETINHDTVIVKPSPIISFISSIVPFLSIGIMLFLGFFLFKMISGKGGGAPTFGKSKAKLSEKSNVRFSDVAGADEEKEETKEIVEFLKNPGRFKQLGARIPKGVLLVGPPGTGKTLLAKAVAGESNVPFFSISGSDFVELYVGVGASRVRDLFENAKKMAPCIIFIDEIDAVGRQRGAGMGGGNDEREQTLNQLLVEMDGFSGSSGIIVMAATNRVDILDPALLRPGRFDRQIYVHVPDVRGREGIIKIHAKNKPIDKDVDFKEIARLTSGATGADIENFLNEAAILAARDGRLTITMEDITEGINKALMGPQKKSRLVTEKDKKITAYHEAGHAIIAKVLDAGYNVHEVSIIPRGMAGGYTSFRPSDDDEFFTLTQANRRIAAIMGGRAAEEIIFKDITTGASSDIVSATKLARKMVTEWGMSKRLGFLNLGGGSELFLGRDYQTQTQYSEKTAAIIDEEVKAILDDNYSQVIKILNDKIDVLHNMANLLLERETIFSEEVDQIMEGVDYKEIIKEIEKKDRARKRRENKKKKELEEVKQKQMQELKLKAAEALSSAGVLSAEDLDVIRKQTKEELEKPNKENKSNKADKDSKTEKTQTAKTASKKKTTTVVKKEEGKEKPKTITKKPAKTTTKTTKKQTAEKQDDSKKDS